MPGAWRDGGADRLGALLGVLKGIGYDLDPQEVLDVLWLAGRLPRDGQEQPLPRMLRRTAVPAQPPPPGRPAPEAEPEEEPEAPPSEPDLPPLTMPELHAAPLPPTLPDLPDLPTALPRPDQGRPALPLLVPEEKALRDELVIGRALRPLKRKRPSPRLREVDEAATAAQLAETRLPDVVLRPRRERWLNLALVVDDGLSMLLWHRLTAELLTTLQRVGAFRSIHVRGIDTRAPGGPVLRGHPFDPNSSVLSPSMLVDPSGQTLVFVVSDGMGSGWRSGAVHDVLLDWAANGPVAILHTLPAALWDGSGIQADRWQATTRRPGGANTSWRVSDRVLPIDFTGLPVPVLQPTAESLRTWTELLTSPGTTVELPLLARPRRHAPVASRQVGSLQYFRDAASPEAYRLAAHLAAVSPLTVPVMRLVQSAVPWQARTTHLAEVFLGGLVHPYPAPVPGPLPAKHRVFDFTEDCKTALLDAVPSGELLRTSRRIGRRLEQLAGRSPDFPAWLAHPEGVDRLPAGSASFTAVERRLMARFGVSAPAPAAPEPPPRVVRPAVWNALTPQDPTTLGPYALRGRRPGRRTIVYLGYAPVDGEAALRTVRPELPPSTARLLDTEAEALRRMDGRYAPELLGTGQEGRTRWIAVRLFPSAAGSNAQPPRLSDLLAYVGPDQMGAFDLLTSLQLGFHLASALSICHLNELVPADLSADSVVVLERTVLLTGLSDCAIDGEFQGAGAPPTKAGNIRELGELLRLVSSRPRAPLPGLPEGMHRWSGDTWQPLRDLVLRCLDADPGVRPSAGEVADKLAQYVAIAAAMRGGRTAGGTGAPVVARERVEAPDLMPSPVQPGPPPDGTPVQPGLPPDGGPAGATSPRGAVAPSTAGSPAGSDASGRAGAPATAPRPPSFGIFGRAERAHRLALVRRPLRHSRRITLVGVQPHSGRATTTVVLGSLFVALREQAALAVDGAPHIGDLHSHLPPGASSTPRRLTRLPPDAPYEEVRRHTGRLYSGLEVLAHRALRATPSPAYADEYRHILALVARHYPVVLIDWASRHFRESADVVLEHTDQLVVCCTPEHGGAPVQELLDDLRGRGWGALADGAVVSVTLTVVNESPAAVARSTLADRHRDLIVVPYDSHLSARRPVDLSRLKPRTANAFLDLAALVMTDPDAPDARG
ncbi:SAV_2336 N-terminal domain-related protein [Streptomyces sp. NPDC007905]|uniref:SAV_2336 N-terminal domain-related protein n=1 Tax=Streptomyces sp. NPDC007905 TaxID=3364788 RepID=UPI0036E0463E